MSPDTTVDEKARAPKRRIKVGDVILIPLPDGRYGYAHHLHKRPHDPQTGLVWLIQVLDRMSEEPFPVDAVAGARPLFPPVFVALPPMVQHGRWKVIGHVPVEGFAFPRFRNSRGIVSGLRHDWEIWDGQKRPSSAISRQNCEASRCHSFTVPSL